MDVVHFSWNIGVLLLHLLHGIIKLNAVNPLPAGRTNIDSSSVPSQGIIMSPQFPEPYKKGITHLYRLQADRQKIQINFITFDVGTMSKKRCVDDFLRVVYADDRSQKLCGQSNYTLTAYKMLTLELVSTPARLAGKRYRGFQATYIFSPIQLCGSQTFAQRNKASGTFMSPAYPTPGYPPDIECHYHIVGSRGYSIVLFFRDFDVHGDDSCYMDYLDIFAINPQLNERSLMTRLCGTFKNHRIASNTTHAFLRFYAVTNKHHRGFLVDYRFIQDKNEPPQASKNSTSSPKTATNSSSKRGNRTLSYVFPNNISNVCGKTRHNGFSGQLTFNALKYSHFNECLWSVEVPAGWQVLLIFIRFRIGVDGLCKDRYVLLYDGMPEKNTKPIAKLCGQRDKIGKEFMSSGTSIYIKLVSGVDKTLSNQNFQINWSAFLENGGGSPCRGFTCAGGKVCIDRAGLSCRELPQRCLHESVKCDGIRNCGTEDDSDESGCISDAVRYSVLGATCFLFVLFLISTVVILKSRASERNCSCASSSASANVNSQSGRDPRVQSHRINGSLNRDLIEMTNLSTTRLPTSSGLASSRHRYSYEVIVNQEALRAAEEATM